LGVVNGAENIGGGQLQNLREALELAQDALFDVHMLVEGNTLRKFKHHGITVHVIPKKNSFSDFFQTYAIFKEIDADFYLARMLTRPQIVYEPLICKMLGGKYAYVEIVDPHLILERPLIAQQMYRAGLKLADLVISNADNIKEKLFAYTKRKIFNINVPTIITKYIKKKREYILWVGRAETIKRPEIFLELARHFPKEKFLMLIAGEYKVHLPSNVTALFNVPPQDVDKYYAASKMLVQTSTTEGFGSVYLEAWKNKTPVVSLTVDPNDVLKKYKTGKHSVTFEQMVKDVGLLLKNNKEWNKCSENSHNYVIKHHDLRNVIEHYKMLFKNIIEGS
jgi:glycosyltransferase involved in cell wall biosynthesis